MFHRKFKVAYFVLEGLNALAISFFFNYVFFYMREHFGFGNRGNLLLTAVHGLLYTGSVMFAGRFAQRRGYFLSLRLGCGLMLLALGVGGVLPAVWGFTPQVLAAEFVVVAFWTFGMAFTWPTLEALVSERESRAGLVQMIGIYNLVWAGGAAIAYFSGGAVLEKLGWQMLFWLPVMIHALQFGIVLKLEQAAAHRPGRSSAEVPAAEAAEVLPESLRQRARLFLRLAWIANPFAYIAMNTLIPVIPHLAGRLGLSATTAGFVCSVWLFARLGAFLLLWLWPGWHYRFRWLVGAYAGLIGSFAAILLIPNLAVIVGAQVVFGVAVGLIYYSSLYYSMDVGETKGEHGGFHEAAIGVGIFSGPALGLAGAYFMPHQANASTWAVSVVLAVGLAVLFGTWRRR